MSNKNLTVQIPDGSIPEVKIDAETVAKWDAKVDTTDLPNIKKNPNATDGDIIDTHLTVGCRKGTVGTRSIVVGGGETRSNEASGYLSAVIGGNMNIASGSCSAVIGGEGNEVDGINSAVIGGSENTASDTASAVIGGHVNIASGTASAVIGGGGNTASGSYSAVIGFCNTALDYQLKAGYYAKDGTAGRLSGTTGDAFIIGNGTTPEAHSNAFRVAYDGSVYGMSAFNSTGADYAEYFEWADGNPDAADRRGLFVTLEGDKIKIAEPYDEIIGVVSATPSVIGNAYDDQWQGMYLTDVFGQPLSHTVHHDAEYMETEVHDKYEGGNELETTHMEQILIHEAYDAEEYIINPDYDSSQKYTPRSQRKEWATVGMFGQIVVVDDGSCIVGGHCTVADKGIATASESGCRVIKRLDENHVKILFK